MGVVMQAASFADVGRAEAWERALLALRDAYVAFERTDPSPWSMDKVPPPLVDFAAKRGAEWPLSESTRFLLKGPFGDAVEILRIDRLVFFWGNGFELGGAILAELARRDGATHAASTCHLRVRAADPAARAAELAAFLDEEEHAGHFTREPATGATTADALFSITFEGEASPWRLVFDGSGMQDWAFVAALPQLDGEDPALEPTG